MGACTPYLLHWNSINKLGGAMLLAEVSQSSLDWWGDYLRKRHSEVVQGATE